MSESQTEQAPAAEERQDTPAPETEQGAPESGTRTTAQDEAPDYFGDNFDPNTLPPELQEAHRSMRADYTRKTQEVAEQRKQAESVNALFNDLQSEDPTDRRNALQWMSENGLLTVEQAAEALGFEIDNGDEQEDPPDPDAQMRQEWEAFKAQQEASQQEAAQQALIAEIDDHIDSELTALAEANGVKEIPQAVADLVVSRALAAHIGPDGKPDVRAAFKDWQAGHDEYQRGWASTKETTHTAAGGSAATGVPDLDTMSEQDRHKWLRERVAEREAATGPGA